MNQRNSLLLLAFLILCAICAAYSNHFHNEFHFDDAHTIQDNGYIRDIRNIPLFFKDCRTSSAMPSHQGYRPLVTTTLAIDYALSKWHTKGKDGYDTLFYHISNFSWFLLIVFLLYGMQVKLYNRAFDEPYNRYFALLGCAWYGLSTVNAETVNYVISRSDILSTLGIVASLCIYLAWERGRKYYLYLLPVMIGTFAKETSIMFAPALMAYDYLIEQQKSLRDLFDLKQARSLFTSIKRGAPALVICFALAFLCLKMTRHHEPGGSSPIWYALTQPYITLHYITEFFVPTGLTADTDLDQATAISDHRIFYGAAFFIGLIVIAYKASEHRQWKPAAFGIIWFILMLLPTSSFIALAEVTNDHRVFLPDIGLVIALVCLVANLFYYTYKERKLLKYGMLVFLLLAFCGYGYGIHERNKVWKTEESLWKDVTEKSPNNGRGWLSYGLCLMDRGDYEGAEQAYDEAMKTTPFYYILHINIGILKEAQGNKEEAEQDYKNALDYGPEYVESYYYYARYLFNNGRVEEAENYCKKGLALFSGHLMSRYLLMDIMSYKKDWKGVADEAQSTLAIYHGDERAEGYLKLARNPEAAPLDTIANKQ